MSRVLRLTLMWLLTVALPLQGVSAATMLGCGMVRHDHAGSQGMHPPAETAARHDHADADGAGAGIHAKSHAHDTAERARQAKTDLGSGGVHKCSACAACCLHAVVPSEMVSFEAVELPLLFGPFVARTLAARVTAGLERPPRFFLA